MRPEEMGEEEYQRWAEEVVSHFTLEELIEASKKHIPEMPSYLRPLNRPKKIYPIEPLPEWLQQYQDGNEPILDLNFKEPWITYGEIKEGVGKKQSDLYYSRWLKRIPSDVAFSCINIREEGKNKCFSDKFAKNELPFPCLTTKGGRQILIPAIIVQMLP